MAIGGVGGRSSSMIVSKNYVEKINVINHASHDVSLGKKLNNAEPIRVRNYYYHNHTSLSSIYHSSSAPSNSSLLMTLALHSLPMDSATKLAMILVDAHAEAYLSNLCLLLLVFSCHFVYPFCSLCFSSAVSNF